MARIPPADTPIIDRASGRISLEWYTALQRVASELSLATSGGVLSFEGRTGAVTGQSGDYTASEITNVAAGNIVATNVQSALNELDTEKQPIDSDLTAIAALTTTAYGRGFLTLDDGTDALDYVGHGNVIHSNNFGLTSGDQSSVVQDIFDAAQDGDTIIFDPVSGIIEVGSVAVADKSLNIDFGAGNSWRPVAIDEQMFLFSGSYSNLKSVTSLTTATDDTDTGSGPNPATVLLMSDTSGFTIGDVVKVYADDLIPDKHTASGGRVVGEHAVIHAIAANTSITLKHLLFDHSVYSTNINVALFPRTTLRAKNLRVYGDTAETEGFSGLVECRTLREPSLENIEANSLRSAFLRMGDCYRYSIEDISGTGHGSGAQSGSDDLPYLIEDVASREGKVQRGWANHVRHLYTTNSHGTFYATQIVRAGRTMHAQVIDCIGMNSLLQPFDTHPEAAHIHFVDCMAINCAIGFQSRGRHVRIINPVVRGCALGFNFTAATNSDTDSIDDQVVIGADAEVTNRLIAVSSGSTVPELLGSVTLIGGRFRVTTPNDTGCVFFGQRRADFSMTGAQIIVDGAGSSIASLFRLQERGACKLEALNIDFTDSSAVDPVLVLYGGTVATPGVATVSDVAIQGASKILHICQNGDLYHDAVAIVDANASMTPQTGDGDLQNWDFSYRNEATTLTNKTIDLTSNTLSGSAAEFNAALDAADFYTTGGNDVAVADGGTGASTARGACANLATWHVLAASGVAVSHTGNTSETALATINVPANAMGANGAIRITTTFSYTNSGNNKTQRVRFGGAAGTQYFVVSDTATLSRRHQVAIHNRNATNSQVGQSQSVAFGSSGVSPTTSAVNTTAAVDIVISGQLANGAETITLENYTVELFNAA